MDSAEQAALSESERDSTHHHHHHQSAQVQMSHRLYESYSADDAKDFPPKPMRRFEKLVVNLTHSSVLVPAGISLDGKIPSFKLISFTHFPFIIHRFRCKIFSCLVGTFGSDIRK